MYSVYAAYVKDALRLLSSYCSAEVCAYNLQYFILNTIESIVNTHIQQEDSEHRDDYLRDLEHALMMPIKHMENYTVLLEILLNEFKEKDFVTEEFKTVATVEIEIKKLFKLVSENYNINSLKGSTVEEFSVYFNNLFRFFHFLFFFFL